MEMTINDIGKSRDFDCHFHTCERFVEAGQHYTRRRAQTSFHNNDFVVSFQVRTQHQPHNKRLPRLSFLKVYKYLYILFLLNNILLHIISK